MYVKVEQITSHKVFNIHIMTVYVYTYALYIIFVCFFHILIYVIICIHILCFISNNLYPSFTTQRKVIT